MAKALATPDSYLKTLEDNGDGSGALYTLPQASEVHAGEVGRSFSSVSVEFTRPADVVAYGANDTVSDSVSATTVQAVTNLVRVNQGSGFIFGARLTTDKKSITPRFRVHLFNASNPTVAVDNVAWKELYADESKRLGFFDLPAMVTAADTAGSDTSRAQDMALRIPFKCAAGTRNIFFVLETLDAFTPASGEKFTLTLYADLN